MERDLCIRAHAYTHNVPRILWHYLLYSCSGPFPPLFLHLSSTFPPPFLCGLNSPGPTGFTLTPAFGPIYSHSRPFLSLSWPGFAQTELLRPSGHALTPIASPFAQTELLRPGGVTAGPHHRLPGRAGVRELNEFRELSESASARCEFVSEFSELS